MVKYATSYPHYIYILDEYYSYIEKKKEKKENMVAVVQGNVTTLVVLVISFWVEVCNALVTDNYTLIAFFEKLLSDYNTEEASIITDGFFFTNNSTTVYDVIHTFTHDTPYLTDTGLYFIDGNGNIIASLIGNITTENEQERITLDDALASATTNTTVIDNDPETAQDMIDYADYCLLQIKQL